MNTIAEIGRSVAADASEIAVEDICVRLGQHEVLADVRMQIQSGEFICIIGPSGCGKTTLLNVMAGFIKPASGEVRVRGERVQGPDPRRIFVFQESGVFPWLTVVENIGLGLRDKSAPERDVIVRRYVEMVGLCGFEQAYPKELSGGMRQRVEIARALAMNPDVIYMDEPFGALDHMTRLRMRSELTQIWQRERKTIVFVTHDIDEAVQLADRIMIMGLRPSTCREVVEVDVPRPRDLDAPECVALRRRLMRGIDHGTAPAATMMGRQEGELPSRSSTGGRVHMNESTPGVGREAAAEEQEYLIVGAGPAGLQLSYFLAKAGLRHRVLERSDVPGSFFQTFPRHRKLISINKVHTGLDDAETNLRWDWNSLLADDGALFSAYTPRYFPHADQMVSYLADFSKQHGLPVEHGFDVARIDRENSQAPFRVSAKDGRVLTSRKLVIATGLFKPWLPTLPGIEFCEPYTSVSINPDDFADQRVLILGKGNSAFETADNLLETTASIHLASPSPVRMAWRTHFVGHLRAINNNFLDTYHLKSQNAVLDAEVREIRREADEYVVTLAYAHADGEVESLRYDRIIACTGFRFDADIFAGACRPEMKSCGRLPVMTSEWESGNVPDLFFAGTLMQYRDYKKYMSGFIHGFRYNIRALSKILSYRYHGIAWPVRAVRQAPVELADALLARANQSSALWQQPGFLCDAVRVADGASETDYLEEVPIDLAKESLFQRGKWLMLTLEFGQVESDPFEISRIHRSDTRRAAESVFLHPIVRYFDGGELLAEHHVIEDLAAIWREPEHSLPLRELVSAVLSGADSTALRVRRPRRGSPLVASGMFPIEPGVNEQAETTEGARSDGRR
jgi:ABC-type nitrate/sulfonate/bicarbonate transport system ATPase subunit/thioredoxin reductase